MLGFCDACSLVHNVAFDPSLLSYEADYDTSLHFSPKFQAYAEELSSRLLAEHGDADLDILEIGCGKGEFLSMLTAGGRNRCHGFDASYDEVAESTVGQSGLTIRAEYYSPDRHELRADLLLSRHVLEHIAEPTAFVAEMGRGLKPGGALFFEVPNGLWTLEDLGIWDLIYEHCTYFTEPALTRVFHDAGFPPHRTYTAYGNQFLCVEASGQAAPEVDPRERWRESPVWWTNSAITFAPRSPTGASSSRSSRPARSASSRGERVRRGSPSSTSWRVETASTVSSTSTRERRAASCPERGSRSSRPSGCAMRRSTSCW